MVYMEEKEWWSNVEIIDVSEKEDKSNRSNNLKYDRENPSQIEWSHNPAD